MMRVASTRVSGRSELCDLPASHGTDLPARDECEVDIDSLVYHARVYSLSPPAPRATAPPPASAPPAYFGPRTFFHVHSFSTNFGATDRAPHLAFRTSLLFFWFYVLQMRAVLLLLLVQYAAATPPPPPSEVTTCIENMYDGNAPAALIANPGARFTGSPVCGDCFDAFVHDTQTATDGPMAVIARVLTPQQVPVFMRCLCSHSEALDAHNRGSQRIIVTCLYSARGQAALSPEGEAAALALFDRSEPTAVASPAYDLTNIPQVGGLIFLAVLFVVWVVLKIIRFAKNCRTICCPEKPTGKTTAMM